MTLFPCCCFADEQIYYGAYINCLNPAMGDAIDQGRGHSILSFAIAEMIRLWHCNETKCVWFEKLFASTTTLRLGFVIILFKL